MIHRRELRFDKHFRASETSGAFDSRVLKAAFVIARPVRSPDYEHDVWGGGGSGRGLVGWARFSLAYGYRTTVFLPVYRITIIISPTTDHRNSTSMAVVFLFFRSTVAIRLHLNKCVFHTIQSKTDDDLRTTSFHEHYQYDSVGPILFVYDYSESDTVTCRKYHVVEISYGRMQNSRSYRY